jgi:hypothetical protein
MVWETFGQLPWVHTAKGGCAVLRERTTMCPTYPSKWVVSKAND